MKSELGGLNKREVVAINSFVKELKEKLGNEIVPIRLFGSKARGDFYQDPNIDITANYDIKYGLPLSPVLYDLFEYQKNKELGSFFFENVEREGILL